MDDQTRIAEFRINPGPAFPGDITDDDVYILQDQIGSSVARLSDTGTLIDQEEYYPFGDSSLRTFTYKRYRYVGKEKDGESGLYYYGARYYAAWNGRFLSVDPLAGKYNWQSSYVYADNNPVNKMDYNGEGTGEGEGGGEPQDQSNSKSDTKIHAKLTGSKNLIIYIKESGGVFDIDKMKENSGDFDYIVADSMHDALTYMKGYYGDEEYSNLKGKIDKLIIKVHSSGYGVLYFPNIPGKHYNSLGSDFDPQVKAIKELTTLLSNNAKILITACQAAQSSEFVKRFGDIILKGTNRTAYINRTYTAGSRGTSPDYDNNKVYSNSETYMFNFNLWLVSDENIINGGFNQVFQGRKSGQILQGRDTYNILVDTKNNTFVFKMIK